MSEITVCAQPPAAANYVGQDGLLYCGRCGTRKQVRITVPGFEGVQTCLCRCEAEALDRARAERELEKRRDMAAQMLKQGIPGVQLSAMTFDRDERPEARASRVARRYVEQFAEQAARGHGLLFYGAVGAGKTFLASCIVNALVKKGVPCLVTSMSRLGNRLFTCREDRQEKIDGLSRAKLLVLDDLGTERRTEAMDELTMNVVETRLQAGLPLIVTTNLTAAKLEAPGDIHMQRLMRRIKSVCYMIEVTGAKGPNGKIPPLNTGGGVGP